MIKVVLADDHEIVREGVKRILSASSEIQVLADVLSLSEVAQLPQLSQANVLLLDVSFSDGSSISMIPNLIERYPFLRVLILSIYPPDQYLEICLKHGAHGYLTKECAADLLVRAIKDVASGCIFVGDSVGKTYDNGYGAAFIDVRSRLTDREYEVFLLLGGGVSSTEIARRLGISSKTISTHQKNIMDKLNLRSKGQLLRFAFERGVPASI